MSDIVERLRRLYPRPIEGAKGDLHEAADYIETLERENSSLRHDIERYQEMNAELHAAKEQAQCENAELLKRVEDEHAKFLEMGNKFVSAKFEAAKARREALGIGGNEP